MRRTVAKWIFSLEIGAIQGFVVWKISEATHAPHLLPGAIVAVVMGTLSTRYLLLED